MDSNPFAPPKTSSANKIDEEFDRDYNHFSTIQTKLKINLATLYAENRRLRSIFLKVPESEITNDDIDPRENRNAPKMKDLLPLENNSSDSDENKQVDGSKLNQMRLLGAMEIDINSLEDEIRELERRNQRIRDRLRVLGGSTRSGTVVISLEDEVVKSVEAREREMEIIRDKARKFQESMNGHGHGHGDASTEKKDEKKPEGSMA
ncbi:MAG: hypothetical protein Q9225_001172 [Loekoesia sp. 1 TL-2023]